MHVLFHYKKCIFDGVQTLSHCPPLHIFSSVEDQIKSTNLEVSTPLRAKPEPSVTTEQPIAQVTPPVVPSAAALESVDLAKIGSILNSLSSVMKNTGECLWSI